MGLRESLIPMAGLMGLRESIIPEQWGIMGKANTQRNELGSVAHNRAC